MHHPLQLAYLGIEVPDPSSLTPFFGEVIGLVPGDAGTGGHDDLAQRRQGAARHRRARPGQRRHLRRLRCRRRRRLRRRSSLVSTRPASPCTRAATTSASDRRVKRLARTMAPWGVGVELTTGLGDAATPYVVAVGAGRVPHRRRRVRPRRVRHHRVRRVARLRHRGARDDAVGLAGDGDRRGHRARGALLPLQPAPPHPGPGQGAVRPAPEAAPPHGRDEHAATTSAPPSTGRGRRGSPSRTGSGMHDNDRMFSFYVASPAGFMVEVGHGARTITDDWDDNRRYDRISAWGHQPLRQP